MGAPISLRLDDDAQQILEDAAKQRGVGLSTYLREMAAREATRIRKERIRAESRAVAQYVRSSPEARAFYEDWGTPTARSDER